MYAGVCGAIYRGYKCANLGFIVHTLCHYREIVATAAGNKGSKHYIWRWLEQLQVEDEGSTSLYEQIYFVGF